MCRTVKLLRDTHRVNEMQRVETEADTRLVQNTGHTFAPFENMFKI